MKYLLLIFLIFSSSQSWASDNVDALFEPQLPTQSQPSNSATSVCPPGFMWMNSVCVGDGVQQDFNVMTCPSGIKPNTLYGKPSCPVWDTSRGEDNQEGSLSNKEDKTPAGSCQAAIDTTEKRCKGAELSQQFGPIAAGVLNSFTAMKSSGDIHGACQAAKKIQAMSLTANTSVATLCGTSIRTCKSTCKAQEDVEGVKKCESFQGLVVAAGVQAGSDATAFAASSACANATAGKCTGDTAFNDEDCQQFCLKPGRQDHPKCQIAMNNCSNANYAAQNVQYCTCVNNPYAPNCSNIAVNTPNNPTATPNFNDPLNSLDSDMDPLNNPLNPARVGAGGGGGYGSGGGAGLGGGGSFAMPGDGSGGDGDESINKDILQGVSGGSGGVGAIFGGGGYNEGSGGAQQKSGSSGSGDGGFDLRAFLPGGKKDPKRNPASAGYADPTITKANGLSNWQKVTRKMNEKRPELMP